MEIFLTFASEPRACSCGESRSPKSEGVIPASGRRLIDSREAESDLMTLIAEVAAASEALRKEIAASLRAVSKLGGHVATPGSRSNDEMGIADERP